MGRYFRANQDAQLPCGFAHLVSELPTNHVFDHFLLIVIKICSS